MDTSKLKEVFQKYIKNSGSQLADTVDTVTVSVPAGDYEIFQDGLKKIHLYLTEKAKALESLKIGNPFQNEMDWVESMVGVWEEKRQKGAKYLVDSISITTRKHLKAAAVMEAITLEQEKLKHGHSKKILDALNHRIARIDFLLEQELLKKTNLPDYMFDYKNELLPSGMDSEIKHKNGSRLDYDVVLSFAGEDRRHAKNLADLLKQDEFSVFYDEYEEHNLWGKNLYDHLSEIYGKRGKYCVMFLSQKYAEKQWPTLERQHAQSRAFSENREYILPIRIDDTDIPGILDTTGYQDLRKKSIEEIYGLLKKKLLSETIKADQTDFSNNNTGDSLDTRSKLAKVLSDSSKNGLPNDPQFSAEELAALLIDESCTGYDVADAAVDLQNLGWVVLKKSIGMSKLGFTYIMPTERLFIETDILYKGWNTLQDSKTLALALLNEKKEGYISVDDVMKTLGWTPRRLNPALALLVNFDAVDPSKAVNPIYYAGSVSVGSNTRSYLRSRFKGQTSSGS